MTTMDQPVVLVTGCSEGALNGTQQQSVPLSLLSAAPCSFVGSLPLSLCYYAYLTVSDPKPGACRWSHPGSIVFAAKLAPTLPTA
jgi:hypothetical protein